MALPDFFFPHGIVDNLKKKKKFQTHVNADTRINTRVHTRRQTVRTQTRTLERVYKYLFIYILFIAGIFLVFCGIPAFPHGLVNMAINEPYIIPLTRQSIGREFDFRFSYLPQSNSAC